VQRVELPKGLMILHEESDINIYHWTWFSFTFHYVDDVFSLINSKFGDNVDRILSIALPRKDTTDTARFVSYLGLRLSSYFSSLMQ
jgi:hypothetical protein